VKMMTSKPKVWKWDIFVQLYYPTSFLSPFSAHVFRRRWWKILTKKSFFYIHSPLKKFVLLLQLLKIFNFCLTFRWRRERTTNEHFRGRNFSPAAAKYVSGKRALDTAFSKTSQNNFTWRIMTMTTLVESMPKVNTL
jgi:hypothetical protein